MRRSVIRLASVTQSALVGNAPVASSITKSENIQHAENLTTVRSLDSPQLQALGVPPTILSVHSPPSVPLYIRRGSLLSIYGLDSILAMRSNLEIISPLKRLLYGNYVSSYQKLLSTTPFSVLVSSASRNFALFSKTNNKSFVSLSLDGVSDWAILDREALHVYTGNSLNVSLHRLPLSISRKLSKTLNLSLSTSTGLHKWSKLGYTLLSGRGQAGLVGNGTVYNVNLKEEEEILVNKNNLLAITVNGPYDLQNCIVKYSMSAPGVKQEAPEPEVFPQHNDKSFLGSVTFLNQVLKFYFDKALRAYRKSQNGSLNFLVGNKEFVRVIGPRNLLLQSNSSNHYVLYPEKGTPATTPVPQQQTPPTKDNSIVASDYLNYVTIGKKGAVFSSTPDFEESVKKITPKVES